LPCLSVGLRFIDAVASIRKTSHEHNYELVVTRSFSEGEEQLLEEDDESGLTFSSGYVVRHTLTLSLTDDEEFSVLIDESLAFTSALATPDDSEVAGAHCFSWDDLAGDLDDSYLFVTRGWPDVKEDHVAAFEDAVRRCMYERKYQQSSAEAGEDELAEFKYR
jgi:hypothetical protein